MQWKQRRIAHYGGRGFNSRRLHQKPEKVTRKGGLFWFLAATGNEYAERVQLSHTFYWEGGETTREHSDGGPEGVRTQDE